MLKIDQKASVMLSLVLNGAVAAVVTVFCIKMPEWLLLIVDVDSDVYIPTLAAIYFTAVLAYAAIVLLFVLLNFIRKGEVFTSLNVACLRAISWLCFGAALCYAVLSIRYHAIAPIVALACAFIGTIIRVIKNAFEKAVEIKTENDFTV